MRVSGFRSFGHARAALLLAATATGCWSVQAIAQTAVPAAATAPHAKLGTWGVDLSARDLTAKPGEDFQKYASGTWLKNTQIAADKPEAGSFYELFDPSQDPLKELVQTERTRT